MSDRMIRVNMTSQTCEVVPFPDELRLLGGRALSARILLDECDASCDPLGPDNVLVLAPGVLSGTAAPTSGRISVGCKSPLTNGIKEANAGGEPGQHLMKLGYRVIVVTGAPADKDKRYAVEVDADGAKVIDATDTKGQWNYELCDGLSKKHTDKASFISIGPAGELQLKGASVACTDQDNRYPTRHAARGGVGAVMGSKGLKYVAIEPGKARVRQPEDKKQFGEIIKSYSKAYRDGPLMFKYGTSSVVPLANQFNTFPTRNRIEGQSPDVETLDGANIVKSFETNGGGMHNCMTGCIVQCSNVVHGADGKYKTSALEFETITMLGANCGIADVFDVADLDKLCDDIGLDTIETGAAVAVYMEADKLDWGNVEGTKSLLKEIAEGTEAGRAIGDGAEATGKKYGNKRIPTCKGQAIPAWDPRPLKATGVTYATSPMGADHTAGLIVNPGLKPDEFPAASQTAQIINAVCDSSGFCQFLQPNITNIADFYSAYHGETITPEQMADQGWQCLVDEWTFNERAGLDESDDVLPQCMLEDGIGPANDVYDVDYEIAKQAKVKIPYTDATFSSAASG